MNAIISIFSAFGLSTAAGLNAYLPLLTVGVMIAVKLAWPAVHVPRLIVIEPVPTTSAAVANWPLALTVLWVDDSAVTDTEYEPVTAAAVEEAPTAVVSDEVAVVTAKDEALASRTDASCRVDTKDCICPKADSLVCIVVAAVCRFVSGRFSTDISEVTMLLTSNPLPMPADEIVPVVLVMSYLVMESARACGPCA